MGHSFFNHPAHRKCSPLFCHSYDDCVITDLCCSNRPRKQKTTEYTRNIYILMLYELMKAGWHFCKYLLNVVIKPIYLSGITNFK